MLALRQLRGGPQGGLLAAAADARRHVLAVEQHPEVAEPLVGGDGERDARPFCVLTAGHDVPELPLTPSLGGRVLLRRDGLDGGHRRARRSIWNHK